MTASPSPTAASPPAASLPSDARSLLRRVRALRGAYLQLVWVLDAYPSLADELEATHGVWLEYLREGALPMAEALRRIEGDLLARLAAGGRGNAS